MSEDTLEAEYERTLYTPTSTMREAMIHIGYDLRKPTALYNKSKHFKITLLIEPVE